MFMLACVTHTAIAHGLSSRTDVQYVKIFDGECDENGNERRMYDGRDNPGNTTDEKVAECSKACRSQKTPKDGKSWADFIAKGFIVNPARGTCYCESADSSTCTRASGNEDYKRYDWTSQLGL